MNNNKIPTWIWLVIPAAIILGMICLIKMCDKSCLETCREIEDKMKEVDSYENGNQMYEYDSFSGNDNN